MTWKRGHRSALPERGTRYWVAKRDGEAGHGLLAAPNPAEPVEDRIWSARAQPVLSGSVWSGEERSKPHAPKNTARCELRVRIRFGYYRLCAGRFVRMA
jgi:hypothetical protein